MVVSCVVYNCAMKYDQRAKVLGIHFYRIPMNENKRRQWIRAINRANWKPSSWERVCGRHFVSGRPSDDPNSVDYCPTKYMKGGDFTSNSVSIVNKPVNKSTNRDFRAAKKYERACIAHITEVCNIYTYIHHIHIYSLHNA
jgi:hypothetical protein